MFILFLDHLVLKILAKIVMTVLISIFYKMTKDAKRASSSFQSRVYQRGYMDNLPGYIKIRKMQ